MQTIPCFVSETNLFCRCQLRHICKSSISLKSVGTFFSFSFKLLPFSIHPSHHLSFYLFFSFRFISLIFLSFDLFIKCYFHSFYLSCLYFYFFLSFIFIYLFFFKFIFIYFFLFIVSFFISFYLFSLSLLFFNYLLFLSFYLFFFTSFLFI